MIVARRLGLLADDVDHGFEDEKFGLPVKTVFVGAVCVGGETVTPEERRAAYMRGRKEARKIFGGGAFTVDLPEE